jgi:hypothetical protein
MLPDYAIGRTLPEAALLAKKETGNVCANCKIQETCLWRVMDNQQVLCNACGLYYVRQ